MVKAALPLLFIVVTLTSCVAGSFRQANSDVVESYRSPGLERLDGSGSIALLTATNGGESGYEYKKLLGGLVEKSIRKNRPEVRVMPYWQSLSLINNKGFTAEYATMLKEYSTTGILDKDVMKKLSGALMGVDFFLQPRLISFQQNQSTRFSVFGLTVFKTHESAVKIYIELWDARSGEIVWIGAAETNMAGEHYMSRPIAFDEVARVTVDKLVQMMP